MPPPTPSPVSVTWNGNAVTGPVLIYHDEIALSSGSAGSLVCTSDSGTTTWHLADGTVVNSDSLSVFFQTTSSPRVSTLLRRVNSSVMTPDHNGLWTCQMSGVGEIIPVGLYQRGGGKE